MPNGARCTGSPYVWTSANWSGKFTKTSDTVASVSQKFLIGGDPVGIYNWSVTFSGAGQSVTKSFTVAYSSPTISWTTPPSSTVTSGQSITVGWNISGGSSVSHTNIHYDTISDLSPATCLGRSSCQSTTALSGSNGNYSATILAPSVTTSTTYYFAAHATVDGKDILTSPAVSVIVNPSCSEPTATPISLDIGSSTSTCIGKGKLQIYSFSSEIDQNYSITLTPQTGDPDLYISTSQSCVNQAPNPVNCTFSQSANQNLLQDSISMTASQTSTYYIAVYGYKDSNYTLNVSAKPVARPDANNNAPNSEETVTFSGVKSVGSSISCGIVSYAWDFGDGYTGSGSAPTHAFTSSSGTTTYTVSLTVTDCIGQTDTKTMAITVTGQAMSINQTQSFSADPVNLATGNYTYEHVDLKIPGIGLPFEFKRFYNSKDTQFTGAPLGFGWSHSYNIKLSGDPLSSLIVLFGNGNSETYTANGDGTFKGEQGIYNALTKNENGNYVLTTKERVKYAFDTAGRLVSISDKNSNIVTLTYDTSGNLDYITDMAGRVIGFTYDTSKYLIQIKDSIDRTVEFTYDTNNNLASVKDLNGGITSFTYDSLHQMLDAYDPKNNKFVSMVYDDQRRVVKSQKDALGSETLFVYDFEIRVTTVTDPLGNKSYHYHDDKLRLVSIKDSQGNIQTFEYDQNGNRTKIVDKKGYATTYTYDSNGNVLTKTDALGNITSITYDGNNNPLSRTDALGKATTFEYDSNGNLIKTTDSLANTSTISYTSYGQPEIITDAAGNATMNTYDAQGNLIQILDSDGKTISFTYDGAGRKLTQTDANGKTTTFTYDNNDNLLTVTNPLLNAITYTYDANNNRTVVKDSLGNQTAYDYDAKDRLTSVKDALGGTITYEYDALDRNLSAKDPLGGLTKYSYDANGNLISVTEPLGNITQYTYDANGNRLTTTDPNGRTTSYSYDALNRLI